MAVQSKRCVVRTRPAAPQRQRSCSAEHHCRRPRCSAAGCGPAAASAAAQAGQPCPGDRWGLRPAPCCVCTLGSCACWSPLPIFTGPQAYTAARLGHAACAVTPRPVCWPINACQASYTCPLSRWESILAPFIYSSCCKTLGFGRPVASTEARQQRLELCVRNAADLESF